MGDLVCSYRNSLSQDLPYDYYLWQGGKACQGKKKKDSPCAPTPPDVPLTRAEIDAFERGKVMAGLKRLPSDEKELEQLLLQAERKGLIKWGKGNNREIYNVLQKEIDSTPASSDMHVIFGAAHHGIDGQTEFFNELLTEGKDRRKVGGVTHLALEISRVNAEGDDVQTYLDNYLLRGGEAPEFSAPAKWRGTNIPFETKKEMRDRNYTIRLAHRGCYNLVTADMQRVVSKGVKERHGEYYSVAAREIFAVRSAFQRQDPGKKDVIFWNWGASHAEKQRLPLHIKKMDPKAKVISVVLNGGTYVEALAFDRVLKKMGWLEKTFILRLDGYREADYIIHVPTRGRKMMWGISSQGDPVVQHIINKPK